MHGPTLVAMVDGVEAAKRALRADLKERRRTIPAPEQERRARALTERLIALATDVGARSIAAYLSRDDEPSTRGLLSWAEEHGIRVLLPVSRPDGLLDWAPYDGLEERDDWLGMPAPTTPLLSPLAINDVDLILVPAAAVDRTGMRMGWGRGYFDRSIGSMEHRPPVYAVVFDEEFLAEVPSQRHDERVDGVVTPSATTRLPV